MVQQFLLFRASYRKMQSYWHDIVRSIGLTQWLPHRGFSLMFLFDVFMLLFNASSFLSFQ